MKKYLLASLAIILAVGFSAFTKPSAHITKGKTFDTGIYWYVYSGSQDKTDRENPANYNTPTIGKPACTGTINECAVQVTVTLDSNGNPPANPDFTNVTFNGTTGFPSGGTAFDANATKS